MVAVYLLVYIVWTLQWTLQCIEELWSVLDIVHYALGHFSRIFKILHCNVVNWVQF